MNLLAVARHLVQKSAIDVASDQRQDAVTAVRDALIKAQYEVDARLEKLETEVAQLEKALAYHYCPTQVELADWCKHESTIMSCGGSPPNYENWKVNVALTHMMTQ